MKLINTSVLIHKNSNYISIWHSLSLGEFFSSWKGGGCLVKLVAAKVIRQHIFYAPLEKGGILFGTVGRYVGLSVCRPSVVRSISFDPFTWSILNLVQGLPSMSRWSFLIFRSHVQGYFIYFNPLLTCFG